MTERSATPTKNYRDGDLLFSFDKPITPQDLMPIFKQASWTHDRTPDTIQMMLDNSRVVIGVWHDDKLVGFARAVTDDIYRALIEDVIVDGDYRRHGIGHKMMVHLLHRLDHVQEVILSAEDHVISFYKRLGFKLTPFAYMNIWKG